MIDWIPNLPVVLIALVALVGMTSLTLAIYALVMHLAESERADALQALSPGMLPPMGILFALIVGFLAVGVWGNVDRAEEVISDEASALRSVVILSDDLPPDVRMRMRAHIRRQIEGAVHEEWPAMREQRATLSPVPAPLADALHLALRVHPQRESETEVQANWSRRSRTLSMRGGSESSTASRASTQSSGSRCYRWRHSRCARSGWSTVPTARRLGSRWVSSRSRSRWW